MMHVTRELSDFGDVYNAVAENYSGNLGADLSDSGIPLDLALDVARTAAVWAVHPTAALGEPPPTVAAATAFLLGVRVGMAWERERR